MLQMSDTTMTKQILLTRRSSAYWRVTSNHASLNIFGPKDIPQLNEIITRHPSISSSNRSPCLWPHRNCVLNSRF